MTAKKKKYSPDSPEAKNLSRALEKLPSNWVACRDMRHAWSVELDFYVTGSGMIQRELVCMRCETHRVEFYIKTKFGLNKLSQNYLYPDGYQIKGVPRGVKPREMLQQEQYRRAMERVVEDENSKTEKAR